MSNKELAIMFAAVLFNLIVAYGASKSTAHRCVAVWWEAIERGDFGQ